MQRTQIMLIYCRQTMFRETSVFISYLNQQKISMSAQRRGPVLHDSVKEIIHRACIILLSNPITRPLCYTWSLATGPLDNLLGTISEHLSVPVWFNHKIEGQGTLNGISRAHEVHCPNSECPIWMVLSTYFIQQPKSSLDILKEVPLKLKAPWSTEPREWTPLAHGKGEHWGSEWFRQQREWAWRAERSAQRKELSKD